jgi:WXXGXW repeat (2 copies)
MNRRVTLPRFLSRIAGAALVAAALGAASGCAMTSGGFYVALAPPPPIVEVRAVAPGAGFVWVPGYYRWDGGSYLWMRGRWERPPRPGARWEPGRWERHGNRGWRYRDGRWR